MSSVLIVIDYQGCFLPGGGLATNQGNSPVTGDKDGKRMAGEIDALIKTNKFSTVYFTKDMHHPDNVSINDKKPFTADPLFYKNRPVARQRDWVKEDDRLMQKKWPRHCTIPPFNPFYSKFVSSGNLKSNNPNNKRGNIIGSKIDEFKGSNGSIHYGAELPFALEKYELGKADGVNSNIVEVYKGFEANTDSYSAVADALGNFTPFIAKENGEFVNPDGQLQLFMDRLMSENPSDIYLTGIARDVCVYWTAMDILNFWIFPKLKEGNTQVPKLHFMYNLTRPVGSVPIEFDANDVPTKFFVVDISKDLLIANVKDLYTKMGLDDSAANYFVVEDSSNLSGGRRSTKKARKNKKAKKAKKTRKNHVHTRNCKKSCRR
jgi:nicotinamidase-related amidase